MKIMATFKKLLVQVARHLQQVNYCQLELYSHVMAYQSPMIYEEEQKIVTKLTTTKITVIGSSMST